MGLDTSHGAWHGAYSAFMRWREEVAKLAGLPPLRLMEGFYEPLDSRNLPTLYHGIKTSEREHLTDIDSQLPIRWECLEHDPIHTLLRHSDCDGEIAWGDCGPIADSLERVAKLMPDEDAGGHIGNWRVKTQTFIDGLRAAFNAKENLNFH